MNHFPNAPENNIRVISIFFRKLAEIIACQGALPVAMTQMANLPPISTTPAVNYAYCWCC
jgi:hypothetical protein